jgi:hypothetical protein
MIAFMIPFGFCLLLSRSFHPEDESTKSREIVTKLNTAHQYAERKVDPSSDFVLPAELKREAGDQPIPDQLSVLEPRTDLKTSIPDSPKTKSNPTPEPSRKQEESKKEEKANQPTSNSIPKPLIQNDPKVREPSEQPTEPSRKTEMTPKTLPVEPRKGPVEGEPFEKSSVEATPKSSALKSGKGGSISVVAEGVGKTETEAKTAAFRDAVGKVVGTIIDATTHIKNDEIISEEILEFSGGFISSYEVLSTKQVDGLTRIRIRAEVEKLQITQKLQKSKITKEKVSGDDLLAQKLTKEAARKDAAKLLSKQFEVIPELFAPKVIGKPELSADEKSIVLSIQVSVDPKKYAEFVKRIAPLLDKVAIKSQSVLIESTPQRNGTFSYNFPAKENQFIKLPFENQVPKGWALWLMTHLDGSNTKAKWNFYWIDSVWEDSVSVLQKKPYTRLELLDKKGEIVSEDEFDLEWKEDTGKFSIGNLLYLHSAANGYSSPDGSNPRITYIAPIALGSGRFYGNGLLSSYDVKTRELRTIRLTNEELAKVAGTKVSIIFK